MPLLDHRPYKQTTIYHFGTTTIVIYIFVVQQIQFKRGRKKIEKGTKTKRFGPKKKKIIYIHFWGGKGITKSLGVPGGSVLRRCGISWEIKTQSQTKRKKNPAAKNCWWVGNVAEKNRLFSSCVGGTGWIFSSLRISLLFCFYPFFLFFFCVFWVCFGKKKFEKKRN